MGIVLDSTIIVAAERSGDTPRGVIENIAAATERRKTRQRFLDELLSEISVEPITTPIALRAGKIDGYLRNQGLHVALADLLIGSTALELCYAVMTHNIRHFRLIPSLEVKQPY